MQASSLTSRLLRCMDAREWRWWQLPRALRVYVAVLPAAALVVIGVAASQTDWRTADLSKFLLLMFCGAISVASTPRIMYAVAGVTRDFTTVWVLPAAILLPPVYAAVMALVIFIILRLCVHRGVLHRMVFTASSVSISYAAASLLFRALPSSFAGESVGTGFHAFTWAVAVMACYIVGGRLQHFMVVGAVKLSDPKVRIWQLEWNREALQELFVEIDLGVLITLAVGVSSALVVIALPTVLLVRRFLVHPLLMAQSRLDAKTGLLNVSTWEKDAESELSRAVRTRNPVALALVDIDHFKLVNDTYGHLVGDRVLRALAEALTGQSRDYDRAGRVGGAEFVHRVPGDPGRRPPGRAYAQGHHLDRGHRPGAGGVVRADRPAGRGRLGDVRRQAGRPQSGRVRPSAARHGPRCRLGLGPRRRIRARRLPGARAPAGAHPAGQLPAVQPPSGARSVRPGRRFFMSAKVTLRTRQGTPRGCTFVCNGHGTCIMQPRFCTRQLNVQQAAALRPRTRNVHEAAGD
jgi:GGDEF domain-containing protein